MTLRGGSLRGPRIAEAHRTLPLLGLPQGYWGHALHNADWPLSAGRLATFNGRSYCLECGSHMVHLLARHAEVVPSTLDRPPNGPVPQTEIWTIRREPWATPVPGARLFERDPV